MINVEDFIKKIEAEFEDLEPGKIKPGSNFRDMFEWNSVNALILIALVNAEYNVVITAADLRSSKTINDIFKIIQKSTK
jgi:acyl carrier protein